MFFLFKNNEVFIFYNYPSLQLFRFVKENAKFNPRKG